MMTTSSFLKTPPQELVSRNLCAICEKPLVGCEEHSTTNGQVHEECYFDELGKLVEAHPPGILKNSHLANTS